MTTPLAAFDARPGQSLETHVRGVVAAATELTAAAGSTPFGTEWTAFMRDLAWLHDFAKLTPYFQTYLETNSRDHAPEPEHTYHSQLGAVVAAAALPHAGYSTELTIAGTYAIAQHHSVLQDVSSDLTKLYLDDQAVDNHYDIFEDQCQQIDDDAAEAADWLLREVTDGAYGWDDFTADGLESGREIIRQLSDIPRQEQDLYGCLLRAWTTLVAADKFDASRLTSVENLAALSPSPKLSTTALESEMKTLADRELPDGTLAAHYLDQPDAPLPTADASISQRLDAIRTRANARVHADLHEQFAQGERVFEFTLPTGFGKTIAGMRAGHTLASKRDSRLIYALPFTSIIDQVDAEIRDWYSTAEMELTPTDPRYTKHHHLADTRSTPTDDVAWGEAVNRGGELLHAEAWRSELTLTTFVQLLESLAGPQNTQGVKLPALQDSVIILDEPQAVSKGWWPLFGRLVRFLTEEYDAAVLLMTATQPRMFTEMDHAPEPVSVGRSYADALSLLADSPRVEFELHDSVQSHLERDSAAGTAGTLSHAAAADELLAVMSGETNVAAVVNTVDSSTTLSREVAHRTSGTHLASQLIEYDQQTQEFDPSDYLSWLAESDAVDTESTGPLITTLTGRLRPRDRRHLLAALDVLLDPTVSTPFDEIPTITVTTQLIEAGVDISFDQLYRDYAPLPSVVQAAGRCNRSFGGPPAPVTLWRLAAPDDSLPPSVQIYDRDDSLLRPTGEALKQLHSEHGSTIPEARMVEAGIERHYTELHTQHDIGPTDALVEAFDTADGQQLRAASLIETASRDRIVLATTHEQRRYRAYQQLRSIGAWEDAKDVFTSLQECIASIPGNADEQRPIPAIENVAGYDLIHGQGLDSI